MGTTYQLSDNIKRKIKSNFHGSAADNIALFWFSFCSPSMNTNYQPQVKIMIYYIYCDQWLWDSFRTPSRPCLAPKSWPRNSVGSSGQPHVVSGRHVFEYRPLLSTLLDLFFIFFNRSSSARAGYFFTFIKSLLKPSMELLPLETIFIFR